MSRFQLLTDAQWSLIEDLLPVRTGKKSRPFRDARQVAEGIIYRYRCGIAWRDVPATFGSWQTLWTWHRRMSEDGTWDVVLARLLSAAEQAGLIDWAVAVDSTIARAHQHATNVTRHTGGWVELQESPLRAALPRHWAIPRRIDQQDPPPRRRIGQTAGGAGLRRPIPRCSDPGTPAVASERAERQRRQAAHPARPAAGRQGLLQSRDPHRAAPAGDHRSDPAAQRSDQPPTSALPSRWTPTRLRFPGLQGPQRHRSRIQPHQTMEGSGHTL